MKNIVLIAGYTKIKYLETIREYFRRQNIVLACVYNRLPLTEAKEKYLKEFDVLFNLNEESDKQQLKEYAQNVLLVTCTQERDMITYTQVLQLCDKISTDQEKLYETLINKLQFKQKLSEIHPELVPKVQIVDSHLLENLDTLSYPQVIKPSGLAGSILIKIVHSPTKFKAHYEEFAEKMKEIGSEFYQKNIDIITEEYVTGPQYSVNVYVDKNKKVTFCPITRVITPQELGINDSYSALQYTTDELPEAILLNLKESVQTVVEEFNIRETSAHFDSVLTENGWKFFEVGLRIGGHRQELYELSHGMDHFQNDILNRLGLVVKIPEQKNAVCIIQKASIQSGLLQKISYVRTVGQEKPPLIRESKMAKVGKVVMPLMKGGGTICRHLVWGKNHDEVVEYSKQLFHSIEFDIEPESDTIQQ